MLHGQRSGAVSLREIGAGLRSHASRLHHLGAWAPYRASLAEANRQRPAVVFGDLLGVMIQHVHRRPRRAMDGAAYLIDSTGLVLNEHSAACARFSAVACGTKLHVVYDPDADCPVYAALSAATVNDVTVAKAMPILARAPYVFDLGYYD